MSLYLAESESSRIFCCEVYKPIGVTLERRSVLEFKSKEVSLRVLERRAQSLERWRRPCLLKSDRGRLYSWRRPCLLKCDRGREYIWQRP